MKGFLLALQFLTIFPLKIKAGIEEKDFAVSFIYFPFIGAFIGLALVCVLIISGFLPYLVRIVLVLVSWIFVTGALHLDGFADTCDGFYAGKSKEERLRIMRDPHIGTMGVVAIVCLLLLKFTILITIPPGLLWKALIMAATFARWSQVLACYHTRYARENGKGKFFIGCAKRETVIIAGLFSLFLFLLLANFKGIILFILGFLFIFLFINYLKKRIGGLTGDTIGAINEVAEVGILFSILILGSIWI